MTTYKSFGEYLRDMCTAEDGFLGVQDDHYEEAFDGWLETKDVNNIMDYAEVFFRNLMGLK